MTVKLYHNPRCSKSRAAADYLAQSGVETEICLYAETAPDAAEIRALYEMLGLSSPREMMRTKDALFAELGLADEQDEEKLIAAIAEYPALLERPIAVCKGKAAIGRPLENIVALLAEKAV